MNRRIRRQFFGPGKRPMLLLVPLAAALLGTLPACASRGSNPSQEDGGWQRAFDAQGAKTPADVDAAYISELSSNVMMYRESLVDDPTKAREAQAMRVRIESRVRAYQGALEAILDHGGDDKQRRVAAMGLGFLSQPAEAFAVVPKMLKGLGDKKWAVQYHALIGFAEMGRVGLTRTYPDRSTLLYALATFMSNENAYLREAAVEAVGRALAPDEIPDILQALIQRLAEEPEPFIRQAIVLALSDIDAAEGYQAIMAQGLADTSADVRWDAVVALARSGQAEHIPSVARMLHDRDAGVRIQAIAALKMFAKRLKPADAERENIVGEVAKLMRDPDSRVRERAILALGNFGDSSVTMDLLTKLGESRRSVRLAAVLALGNIGDDRAIVPLIKNLATRDEEIRDATRSSLIKITKVDLGEEATAWQSWVDAGRPPIQSPARGSMPKPAPADPDDSGAMMPERPENSGAATTISE